MKHLDVKFFKSYSLRTAINKVSVLLDSVDKHILNQAPWTQYNYVPSVHFAMAYGSDCIFLKYYVEEKYIRAVHLAPNTAVTRIPVWNFL